LNHQRLHLFDRDSEQRIESKGSPNGNA